MKWSALLVVLVAAGCGSSNTASSTPISGHVSGQMKRDVLATTLGDKQAVKKLASAGVYCGWQGTHVVLHVRFTNGLAAHVTVHVNPVYVLKNAGKHGDGPFNELSVGIDAQATRDWVGDLGAPAGGIKAGTQITHCIPKVAYVELG